MEHPGRRRSATSRRAPDGGRCGDGVDAAARRLVRADEPRRDRRRGLAQEALRSRAGPACASGSRASISSIHSGNLSRLICVSVAKGSADSLIKVKGQLKGSKMEIVSRGRCRFSTRTCHFEYEPRSVVQDVLGPLDRLPGLHVGQRWESQIVNPFSGQVESVRVEVVRRGLINWEGNPVTTFEVVQRTSPLLDEDLGPHRRSHLATRGAVSIREAGAGAPGRRRHLSPANHPKPGCQPHDRTIRRDQAVRHQVRGRPARPRGPAGRAVRVSRAQRRGQDNDDQDDLRPALAQPRDGPGRRLRRLEPAGTAIAGLCSRPAVSVRQAHRARIPQVRRGDVRAGAAASRPSGSTS